MIGVEFSEGADVTTSAEPFSLGGDALTVSVDGADPSRLVRFTCNNAASVDGVDTFNAASAEFSRGQRMATAAYWAKVVGAVAGLTATGLLTLHLGHRLLGVPGAVMASMLIAVALVALARRDPRRRAET